jgi:hypothetical protein
MSGRLVAFMVNWIKGFKMANCKQLSAKEQLVAVLAVIESPKNSTALPESLLATIPLLMVLRLIS